MADLAKLLPPLLVGEELFDSVKCLPEYSDDVRNLSASERLQRLTDIYRIFVPTTMFAEIYHKLYMMTSMSLRQKGDVASVRRLNETYKWSHGGTFHGVATGATSATVIGVSGIGKSTCIQYAVERIGPIVEIREPYHRIIPVLEVTTPFNSNYKDLLCAIVIKIDSALGTEFYNDVGRQKMNAQQVLGMVCQLCHLYVGTLIVDEIQFLVEHRAGKQLYMMIMQLINTASINVLMVGTTECIDFFRQAPQMARRSVGLQYGAMEYGDEFRALCRTLYRYQYVQARSTLTESVTAWLYEHSGGVSASLVALVHDAQEIAILRGLEALSIETLTLAYNNRMKMVQGLCKASVAPARLLPTTQIRENPDDAVLPAPREAVVHVEVTRTIAGTLAEARADGFDAVEALKGICTVEEV